MLADPVTIAARAPTPALTLRVVKSDGYGSERRDDAGSFTVIATHTPSDGKVVERHFLKVNQVKDAVNPYTGGTSKQTASVTLQCNVPPFGWTLTEKVALVNALLDVLQDAEVTISSWLLSQS
jgi:hypothetical protein